MDTDPQFVKEIDEKAAAGDGGCVAAARCLQAMRSVICSNRCPVTATSYFAAAVAALQKHLEGSCSAADSGTASALLLVLRKALPNLPESVVQARFNDLALSLAAVIKVPDNEGLIRQALACMSVAADIAYNAGARPNRKILKPIFSLLEDKRIPVRHQAELTATLIVKRAAAASDQQTMDFVSQHLVQMIAAAKPDKKGVTENSVHQALTLVRAVAPLLPLVNLSAVCLELLRLPTLLGQHPCCTEAFEFLASHLRQNSSSEAVPEQTISLAVQVFPGLLNVPTQALNAGYVAAYAMALAAAISALASPQVAAAVPETRGFKLAAAKRLVALFKERDPTLLRGAREAALLAVESAGGAGDVAFLEELPELTRPLLGYESKGAWPQALPVIAGLFRGFEAVRSKHVSVQDTAAWASGRFERVRGLLQELVEVRDKMRAAEINAYGREISQCLGAAVAAFGPELVLGIAPLELLQHSLTDSSFEQLSRSWMLLVLREHCRRTSLAYFVSAFLPLATAVRGRCVQAQTTSPLHAKKYENMLDHIWAVLPAFCTEPLDLNTAMLAEGGRFAKQLVSVLLNEKDLRVHVWMAFTRACESTRHPQSDLSRALQDSNVTCLRTLSSRVLPEMFNAFIKVYTETENQDTSTAGYQRQVALEAVQSYVQIAEPSLVGKVFKELVARVLKATTADAGTLPADEQAAVVPTAELAVAIVPHLAPESLELVLKVFSPMLNAGAAAVDEDTGSAAATLQRAAYRAIAAVLEHDAASKIGDAFKILELWTLLRDARQTCGLRAIKARLMAIQALLLLMQERLASRFQEASIRQGYLECLSTVLPEIMQHLRDPGSAFRDIVRDCLHIAVTTAIHQDFQAEIVAFISAGLAGLSRHSKAAAVDTFSRLMYEHSAVLSEELQDRLIHVVLLLLEDLDAQVWRAALKFAKVVVFVAPEERILKVLPQMFKLFQSQHLATGKMLVRSIIERLAKVLPAEQLLAAFPRGHLPLLHYVQRQVARQKRPKTVREAKGTEEGNEEDAEMADGQGSQKSSWDAFNKEEEEGIEDVDILPARKGRRKRRVRQEEEGKGEEAAEGTSGARASREPPDSAIAAHDAVQALLDAWTAEGDSGDEATGRRGRGQRKRKHEAGESGTWIHEDREVPLDFMSADAAHSVLTVRPPQRKRQRGQETGAAGAQNRVEALRRSGLHFAEDGRLVVSEEAEAQAGNAEAEKRLFNLGDVKAPPQTPLSRLAEMRRRRAAAKVRARLLRGGVHTIQGLDQFKPKKRAQGDAKRKGQTLNPYAYMRLNPKVVREKDKDKATASFARLVKATKQGVLRGKKARRQDAKKQAPQVKKTKHGRKVKSG